MRSAAVSNRAMRTGATASVLHVIPAVAPRYGGPSAAVVGMCRALSVAGVSAMIATTDADGPGRLPVEQGRLQTYSGVPAYFFQRVASEAFKVSPGLAAWLKAHVRDFDLVHIHAVFSHSSVAAGRACAAMHVPYVVRPLGTLDPWSLERKKRQKQWLLQWPVGQILRAASGMHYTTAEEMRLAEGAVRGLPAGFVVPVGVDDGCFVKATEGQTRAPYVLSASRLEAKKGVDLLIRAFHLAAQSEIQEMTWNLVIGGDGDASYVAYLRDLAEAGPARSRIRFEGWVSGEAKRRLFRDAALFALASHQENFGIAVAEAMASGVPVVVTPGVNLADQITSAGAGWVSAPEADALAQMLRAAMGDGAERARRGERARALAESFRWPLVAAQLISVYNRLSGRHRSPVDAHEPV